MAPLLLTFRDDELEKKYGEHVNHCRAKTDWMGMILEAWLWVGGVRSKYKLNCLNVNDHFVHPALMLSVADCPKLPSRSHTTTKRDIKRGWNKLCVPIHGLSLTTSPCLLYSTPLHIGPNMENVCSNRAHISRGYGRATCRSCR